MPQYSTTRADVAALWTEKQPAITEYLAHNLARSPDDPRVAELAEEVFRRALDTITRKALTDDGKMCSTFFNQARLAVAREKKARSTGTRPLRPRLTVDEADALVSQAFETHYPTLVRFVTAQIANPEQAEEIASDAFLDLRESLLNGRLDTTLPMAPWLYRSAKNRVANVRRAAVSIPLSWDVPDRDASHDPLTVLTRQETTATVRAALAALPAQVRQVVLLLAEGLRLTEVAERLGLSWREARRCLDEGQAQMQAALTAA